MADPEIISCPLPRLRRREPDQGIAPGLAPVFVLDLQGNRRMSTLAAVVVGDRNPVHGGILDRLAACPDVGPLAVVAAPDQSSPAGRHHVIRAASARSSVAIHAILDWFDATRATDLLWIKSASCDMLPGGVRRLRSVADDLRAVMVYADYYDGDRDGSVRLHPLIDYQVGSLRDDFDFGPVVLLRGSDLRAERTSLESASADATWGGWYDLRLRLSERGAVVRLPEPVCTSTTWLGQRVKPSISVMSIPATATTRWRWNASPPPTCVALERTCGRPGHRSSRRRADFPWRQVW